MTTVPLRRRISFGIAFTLLAALLFGVAGTERAEAAAGGEVQWSTCYRDVAAEFADFGVAYECTQINVPLDHDRPNGATISLALVRIPATDTENYRGSLFLNPGGPGGSGIDFALFFGPFAPFAWGPVANQYDIVGFDPRGIGRSTALRCFGNLRQAVRAFPPLPFPFLEEEVPLFVPGDNLLNEQCMQRGNKVLEHMSTANVARDLDLLREKLGNDHLNYVGLSYGSFLGQTYANLFPDRVGALVIDGVLDPVAWSNLDAEVPFSVALRSDVGAQATLDEFIRQCNAAVPGNCALAPDAGGRLDALLDRLRSGPILITDPGSGESFPYFYSFAVADMLGALYDPGAFPDLAQFLAFLEAQADPAALGFARQEMQQASGLVNKRGFPNYPNFVEGFPGVACEDTTNPAGGHEAWFEAGKAATAEFGIFGELWAWASEPCTVWSSFDDDVYKGPYDTSTANPVLVIGNFYDPATRYEGAQTANGLLADSALLSVDEPGHTSLGLSGCAGFFTGVYLEDTSAASAIDGFVCPSEGNWFDKLAGGPGGEGMGTGFRTRLMEDIAFRP